MDPAKSQVQSESELVEVPETPGRRRSTIRFRKKPKSKEAAPPTVEYGHVHDDIQNGDILLYQGRNSFCRPGESGRPYDDGVVGGSQTCAG
jgi:hypothetical protein